MEFLLTEKQKQLRQQVQRFLEDERSAGRFEPHCDSWGLGFDPGFSKRVAAKGWIGLTLPTEYGGQGKGPIDRLVLTEELLRYGAPCGAHWFSDRQVGPCLLDYGTEEQKKNYLPRICRAEIFFALGLSEPEAGSDLSSVKTMARKDGDHYVISGQKVWTSGAHLMTHIYTLLRTDPDVPKHKGLSEFIVDLKSPGITVQPIMDTTGREHFNEVFFDEVRVPAANLVGTLNNGWRQITAQLDYERSGIERLMGNYPMFDALARYMDGETQHGKALGKDPVIKHRMAELTAEFEVGRMLIYRAAWMLEEGIVPNYESAMAKLYATEFQQQLSDAAIMMLGSYGDLTSGSKIAPMNGLAPAAYLFSPGLSLMAGTSEIMRNLIAQRGLGLPAK
jgi:alkylation response protein AidB-like acyl-CoA dehydrogenase